tara:strand:- start:477 stop:722 length:246 start_codon:yes stop_codon:yes gene_type:complete
MSDKKDARKSKAIVRKLGKIASLKKQLKTPSKTSGARGVKDYNPSSNKKIIARKDRAITRKINKISEKARRRLFNFQGEKK